MFRSVQGRYFAIHVQEAVSYMFPVVILSVYVLFN